MSPDRSVPSSWPPKGDELMDPLAKDLCRLARRLVKTDVEVFG